tara:strand:+ start:627 stop:1157 length:531 start_codon:yes stop_codon:yes gene_type:complete
MADLEIIAEGNASSSSISLTSIDQSYQHLSLDCNFQDSSTGARAYQYSVLINGDNNATWDYGYSYMALYNGGSWSNSSTYINGYVNALMGYTTSKYQNTNQRSAIQLFFPGYSNTDFVKTWMGSSNSQNYYADDSDTFSLGAGARQGTSAITSIELRNGGGTSTRCNYTLYGWKAA